MLLVLVRQTYSTLINYYLFAVIMTPLECHKVRPSGRYIFSYTWIRLKEGFCKENLLSPNEAGGFFSRQEIKTVLMTTDFLQSNSCTEVLPVD